MIDYCAAAFSVHPLPLQSAPMNWDPVGDAVFLATTVTLADLRLNVGLSAGSKLDAVFRRQSLRLHMPFPHRVSCLLDIVSRLCLDLTLSSSLLLTSSFSSFRLVDDGVFPIVPDHSPSFNLMLSVIRSSPCTQAPSFPSCQSS